MLFREFSVMAEAVFLPTRISSQPFDLFLSNPQTMSFLACFGMATIIMTALPFGLRSAPFLFNMLSDAVEWILLNYSSMYFIFLQHFRRLLSLLHPLHPPPPPTHTHSQTCQVSLSSMLLLVFLWQLTKPKAQTMSYSSS